MDIECIPVADHEDRYVIYRPLAGLAFVGNRALADIATALARGSAGEHSSAGEVEATCFLRSIGFLQTDPEPPPLAPNGFRPTTGVLLLTNRCQLRCAYCYASAGEKPREELSVALGRVAIEHVAENAQGLGLPSFHLSFHGGGEPTLAWKTLQACADHARHQPVPAHVSLTSNTIWSRSQTAWIAANMDALSLSIDGDTETQDRQRPFLSGAGSSTNVMRCVAELDRRGFDYGIRMTATEPFARLPQQVRFLCEHTGCRSIQVEPSFNTVRGGHGQPTRAAGRAFADAFLDAHELASEAGRRLHYSGARLDVAAPTFCTAPYEALVVDTRGHLVTCYEISSPDHPLRGISVVGRIEEGRVVVDERARARLHALMAARREGCRDCYCYWSCAGDCYARTFRAGPQGHLRRGVRCEINRHITLQLLLRGIASGGGVWHGSRRPAPPSRSDLAPGPFHEAEAPT
jgi:uncharacterized protein